MNRGDIGLISLQQGVLQPLRLRAPRGRPRTPRGRPRQPLFELLADPPLEFAGGFLGKGDGNDLAQAGPPAPDDGNNPSHEDRRLARAGPRLQQVRAVQVVHGGFAGGLIHGNPHQDTPFRERKSAAVPSAHFRWKRVSAARRGRQARATSQ